MKVSLAGAPGAADTDGICLADCLASKAVWQSGRRDTHLGYCGCYVGGRARARAAQDRSAAFVRDGYAGRWLEPGLSVDLHRQLGRCLELEAVTLRTATVVAS